MGLNRKTIQKWNDIFKAASKSEKRIMVAKDVLQQLKIGKYKSESYTYVDISLKNFDTDFDNQFRENFDKIEQCRCCGVGSMILSLTKFNNKFTFNDLNKDSNEKIWIELSKFFSKQQICWVEFAFEGWEMDSKYQVNNPVGVSGDHLDYVITKIDQSEEENLLQWRDKFSNDTIRLTKIMQNIIRNSGNFVPKDIK